MKSKKIEIIGFEKGYHAHLNVVQLVNRYCDISLREAWELSDANIHNGKTYKVKVSKQSNLDSFINGLKKNHVIYRIAE
jgi:hypothetical protein